METGISYNYIPSEGVIIVNECSFSEKYLGQAHKDLYSYSTHSELEPRIECHFFCYKRTPESDVVARQKIAECFKAEGDFEGYAAAMLVPFVKIVRAYVDIDTGLFVSWNNDPYC